MYLTASASCRRSPAAATPRLPAHRENLAGESHYELSARLQHLVASWGVRIERCVETPGALIAFGRRDAEAVVLKLVRRQGDEWSSGSVLHAFGGRGVVRVLEHIDGAMLLERLQPGESLEDARIPDDQATSVVADVIERMSPAAAPPGTPTVEAWGRGFDRYLAKGELAIPRTLAAAARSTYRDLCGSQSGVRLLHGDLHHGNVLLDSQRGRVAIDPKGVIGEAAFETGALLRNPCHRPEVFAAPATIGSRVQLLSRALGLDSGRILAWAFAQAVLAAIWELEDRGSLTAGAGWINFACAVRPMLAATGFGKSSSSAVSRGPC